MIALRDIVPYTPARAEIVRTARKVGIKIEMRKTRFATITGNFTTHKTFFISKEDIVPLYEALKQRAKSKYHLAGFSNYLDESLKQFENYIKQGKWDMEIFLIALFICLVAFSIFGILDIVLNNPYFDDKKIK